MKLPQKELSTDTQFTKGTEPKVINNLRKPNY